MICALLVFGWGCNETEQVTLDEPVSEDMTHVRLDAKHNPIFVKRFLIDHNINLMRQFGGEVIGIGLTVVNSGASYDYQATSSIIKTHDIEFKTYNAFVTFPLKKIFFGAKSLVHPKGIPSGCNQEIHDVQYPCVLQV